MRRTRRTISRREFLGGVARAGGAAGLALALPRLAGCGEAPLPGLGWPVIEAELCTITESMAAFTWVTESEQPTAIRYGRTADLDQHLESPGPPGLYHYLEVPGLAPGTEYNYRLSTIEEPAGDDHDPGRFTTLTLPAGELRFTFATLNDLHVGCDRVGLLAGGGEAFTWPDPSHPSYVFAQEAAVSEINALRDGQGVDFVVVKGDLTGAFTEAEFLQARELLDRLRCPYYPLRGNHDRIGDNPEDYFLAVFGDLIPGGESRFAFQHGGHRLVCLDSSDLQSGAPYLDPAQLDFLGSELSHSQGDPVLVFLHHPVTVEASIFSLSGSDCRAFGAAVRDYDNLVGVFTGHSHRDYISYTEDLGTAPCVETAATQHYPLGFTLYRVFDGGYVQTCHRLHGVNCLEWNEMTRRMYSDMAEELLWLEARQRNFVFPY